MKIKRDLIRKFTNELLNILIRWKNKKFIDELTYKKLLTIDRTILRCYGVLKIINRIFH